MCVRWLLVLRRDERVKNRSVESDGNVSRLSVSPRCCVVCSTGEWTGVTGFRLPGTTFENISAQRTTYLVGSTK